MSVAFVLGGGGRWGAVEVGMLAAIVEADIAPDTIVGTSIGAVNGAMFAADPTRSGIDRLEQTWRQLKWSDFTDSDELIAGALDATACYLVGTSG